MSSSEAAFLKGRSVRANWDVDELKSQAQAIQSGLQMTSGIYGWPYPHTIECHAERIAGAVHQRLLAASLCARALYFLYASPI